MAEHAVRESRGEEGERTEEEEEAQAAEGGGEGRGGEGEKGTQADGRLPRPRQDAMCAAEQRRRPGDEVFHVYGPAEMSTLLFLSASQLIRAPPSARGTNKKR